MNNNLKMIVLAAGQGTRLKPLTDDKPKCMVELHEKPLLYWNIAAARKAGIENFVLVGGYRHEELVFSGMQVVLNKEYASTNMVYSLWTAREHFGESIIMAYGDIVYEPKVIKRLLADQNDIAVVVDRQWHKYWQMRFTDPLSDAESLRIDETGKIASIGQKAESIDSIQGQYIGLVKFEGKGLCRLVEFMEREHDLWQKGLPGSCPQRPFDRMYMTDLLQGLINSDIEVSPVWIERNWLEIDSPEDLSLSQGLSTVSGELLSIH